MGTLVWEGQLGKMEAACGGGVSIQANRSLEGIWFLDLKTIVFKIWELLIREKELISHSDLLKYAELILKIIVIIIQSVSYKDISNWKIIF